MLKDIVESLVRVVDTLDNASGFLSVLYRSNTVRKERDRLKSNDDAESSGLLMGVRAQVVVDGGERPFGVQAQRSRGGA